MKSKKRNIGSDTSSPIIIREGGGIGTVGIVAAVLGVGGAVYFGNRYLKQRAEAKAEQDSSLEGQIASQLKLVFDKFPVSDADYRTVALQITDSNKAKVYQLYKSLTGRNLSDDIASHIGAGSLTSAIKIQAYNSKVGRTFSITSDNKIKFEVMKGGIIGFDPSKKSSVTFYNNAIGIVLNDLKNNSIYDSVLKRLKSDRSTVALTVSIDIIPSTKRFKVVETKELPFDGLKSTGDFWEYLRPYVRTRKNFAAIKIMAGKDKTGKIIYAWVDGRDMVSIKKTEIKGIGNTLLL